MKSSQDLQRRGPCRLQTIWLIIESSAWRPQCRREASPQRCLSFHFFNFMEACSSVPFRAKFLLIFVKAREPPDKAPQAARRLRIG